MSDRNLTYVSDQILAMRWAALEREYNRLQAEIAKLEAEASAVYRERGTLGTELMGRGDGGVRVVVAGETAVIVSGDSIKAAKVVGDEN